jgi:hypothetical protein
MSPEPRRSIDGQSRHGATLSDRLCRTVVEPKSLATVGVVAGAALLVWSSVIHLHLWSTGYRHIPTIGPLFLVQGIIGIAVAAGLVVLRRPLAFAGGALFALGTAGGLLLSVNVGLFGFQDSLSAPFAVERWLSRLLPQPFWRLRQAWRHGVQPAGLVLRRLQRHPSSGLTERGRAVTRSWMLRSAMLPVRIGSASGDWPGGYLVGGVGKLPEQSGKGSPTRGHPPWSASSVRGPSTKTNSSRALVQARSGLVHSAQRRRHASASMMRIGGGGGAGRWSCGRARMTSSSAPTAAGK